MAWTMTLASLINVFDIWKYQDHCKVVYSHTKTWKCTTKAKFLDGHPKVIKSFPQTPRYTYIHSIFFDFKTWAEE